MHLFSELISILGEIASWNNALESSTVNNGSCRVKITSTITEHFEMLTMCTEQGIREMKEELRMKEIVIK